MYPYGLDAESISREFLTHLAFTLAELPEHVDSEWEPKIGKALSLCVTASSRVLGSAPRRPISLKDA